MLGRYQTRAVRTCIDSLLQKARQLPPPA